MFLRRKNLRELVVVSHACNEGSYETSFFGKHFMKNGQETTSIHYNLISNRRHALRIAMKLSKSVSPCDGIAMKLSKSFSPCDGGNVTATEGRIDWLMELVKKGSSKVPGSVEVMKRLKEKNENL